MNILVVCQGNICRSPVAEAMLRKALPDRQVQSAGLQAMTGRGVDEAAAELASAEKLDVSAHQAQQLSSSLIQWADLILVMSHNQRGLIGQQVPEAMGKTLLLGHWIEGKEIPDPYKKSREVFEHVHKLMAQSIALWANKI